MDGNLRRTRRTRKTPNTSANQRATTDQREKEEEYLPGNGKKDDDEIKASSPSRAKSVVCSFVVWLFVVENFAFAREKLSNETIFTLDTQKTLVFNFFFFKISHKTTLFFSLSLSLSLSSLSLSSGGG